MRPWRWAALLLVAAAMAFPQVGEIALSGGMSTLRNAELGRITEAGTTYRLEASTDVRIGVRFTTNNDGFRGHEFGYAYSHGNLALANGGRAEVGMPVHQGFYNFLLYGAREGTKVRPFMTGGGHFSTFYPPGTGVFSGNGVTKFGVNYGGGVKARVGDMFIVRVDVRDYLQPKPNFWEVDLKGWLHMLEASVGFGFVF